MSLAVSPVEPDQREAPLARALSLLDLWGKTVAGRQAQYLPLLTHLLDSQALVGVLWERVWQDHLRHLLVQSLGVDEQEAVAWLGLLAALHDLGKATPGFQGSVPLQRERLLRAGWRLPPGASQAHDSLGIALLQPLLAEWAASGAGNSLDLATAIAGHHGRSRAPGLLGGERHFGDGRWTQARSELVRRLTPTDLSMPLPPGLAQPSVRLLCLLGGIVRVVDWLASHTPQPDGASLRDPACLPQTALERAEAAVAATDWDAAPPDHSTFADVMGFAPHRAQQGVCELAARLGQPAMVIVETPPGTGKTETALYLAHCWQRQGHQRGIFIGLPTQASAAAMQERLRQYPGYEQSVLAHAGAPFGEVALPVRAARLLQPAVIGTVDQALLAVVSDRQAWVRLLGLAYKTVILDEVHAYDAYTSRLLERLVEWLAALHCSVIVLSATLPREQRRRLLQAYGAPAGPVSSDGSSRVTLGARSVLQSLRLPSEQSRIIRLRHLPPGRERLLPGLVSAAEEGCVGVICNTVAEAQRLASELRQAADATLPVHLLHARLPQAERRSRERHVVRLFGKAGPRPRRAILVATQVAEQSLDLDFDLLVTEFAPLDVLLQRVGRLHRHDRTRPARLQAPQVWLLGPEEREGRAPAFGVSSSVYDEYILLRSWLALRDRDHLCLPQETAALVEDCYGGDARAGAAEPWARDLQLLHQRSGLARQMGEFRAGLACTAGPHSAALLPPAGLPATRLQDLDTLHVVCRRLEDVAATAEDAAALWEQAIPVRDPAVVEALRRRPRPEAWRAPALRALTPLWLDEHSEALLGNRRLRLDQFLGLVIEEV